MAEKIKARRRVKEAYFGDPITSKEAIASANFATKLPFTLRDDELAFSQEDPDVEEVYVHEVDSPVFVNYTAKPIIISGTFLGLTDEQKALLLGGTKESDGYHHSSKISVLNKSMKVVDHSGNHIICTNITGYVKYEPGIGKGGLERYPFKFTCLAGSPDWQVDIVEGKGSSL